MNKRILALITAVLLVLPSVASAATTTPTDFFPSNVAVSGDFKLPVSGKIRTAMEPFLSMISKNITGTTAEDKAVNFFLSKLKQGANFTVGFAADTETFYMSFPITTDEWNKLITDLNVNETEEKTVYNGYDIYEFASDGFIVHLGDYILITISLDAAKETIDLATDTKTNSFSKITGYSAVTSKYLSPRVFSATINSAELVKILQKQMGSMSTADEVAFGALLNFLEPMQIQGFSLGEKPNAYNFTAHVNADASKLTAKNMSLNPGGSFMPSLYTKLGNAKPIFYSETFNQKKAYEQTKILTDQILNELGDTDQEAAMVQKIMMEVLTEVYSVFTQESAVAVQYNTNSMLPYFTVMGNVSENKSKAQTLSNDIAKGIEDLLNTSGAPQNFYKKTVDGNFTNFIFDLSKLNPNSQGAKLGKVTFTFGVTLDGLLIFSNYPNIQNVSTRTGIAGDADFAQFVSELKTPLAQTFYFNARNVWGYTDNLLSWIDKANGTTGGVSLDGYRDYYSMVNALYPFKDVFVVSRDTDSSIDMAGTITVDAKTHKTFTQFMDELKSKDTDGDGISDFDEKFLYYTSIDNADSDGDGVSDIDELKQGQNPYGSGTLFKDVSNGAYYTDEVGFLNQRKAISGYPDGTFGPGKSINRAEFTAIVVKAFERGGINLNTTFRTPASVQFNPFTDVSANDWYYNAVVKAYSLGLVSGSSTNSGKIFRPGDTITRAEAITILNRASRALVSTRWQNSCRNSDEKPFNDVKNNDWFCDSVLNAYNNGLTTGKAPGEFKPNDSMTRAEAAVMIQRAHEKDFEYAQKTTPASSLGSLFQF